MAVYTCICLFVNAQATIGSVLALVLHAMYHNMPPTHNYMQAADQSHVETTASMHTPAGAFLAALVALGFAALGLAPARQT